MRVVRVIAFIGCVASLLVHASTFLPEPPAGMDKVWPLHIGALACFIPAVMVNSRHKRGNTSAGLFDHTPRWMLGVLGVFFLYALLNFAVFTH